jgi:hypothetical protein
VGMYTVVGMHTIDTEGRCPRFEPARDHLGGSDLA